MTARPGDRGDAAALLHELSDVIRRRDAQIVSQTVFGGSSQATEALASLESVSGEVTWPVTWLDGGSGLMGTQISALSGTDVECVTVGGRVKGSVFEDKYARYCFLGNLATGDVTRSRGDQVRDAFGTMEATLGEVGMGFEHVVRTWLYIDDILGWYDELNDARTAFFNEREVFERMMPASTGIGVSNLSGSAIVAECIAMQPKSSAVTIHDVPSPLQCEASDYRSSFSRAAEVVTPDHRRLYISGTASIGPDGDTVHVGDVDAQIEHTMDVVKAILDSKGMGWSNLTRGVAYFRDIGDLPILDRYCETHGVPRGVLLETPAVVCRDDLLFELEANAIAS
ncbi:MAG: endoribonuclease L-PSP [Gemmatimonadota bacterium]|nr:MAG: endoribonuclease L-PSP [Gemmatimonadota bacterium]